MLDQAEQTTGKVILLAHLMRVKSLFYVTMYKKIKSKSFRLCLSWALWRADRKLWSHFSTSVVYRVGVSYRAERWAATPNALTAVIYRACAPPPCSGGEWAIRKHILRPDLFSHPPPWFCFSFLFPFSRRHPLFLVSGLAERRSVWFKRKYKAQSCLVGSLLAEHISSLPVVTVAWISIYVCLNTRFLLHFWFNVFAELAN